MFKIESAAQEVLETLKGKVPRLEVIYADRGYHKQALQNWCKAHLNCRLEISQHPWQDYQYTWALPGQTSAAGVDKPKGFVVLPKRWVVERTFAWLGRYRSLSKDYEQTCRNQQAFILIAMTVFMLR